MMRRRCDVFDRLSVGIKHIHAVISSSDPCLTAIHAVAAQFTSRNNTSNLAAFILLHTSRSLCRLISDREHFYTKMQFCLLCGPFLSRFYEIYYNGLITEGYNSSISIVVVAVVAVENLGAFSTWTSEFLRDLGHQLSSFSGEE